MNQNKESKWGCIKCGKPFIKKANFEKHYKKFHEPVKIDYTMEQFLAETKHREKVDRVLERMLSVMEKFQNKLILDDYTRKQHEKYMTDLGVRVQKLEKRK